VFPQNPKSRSLSGPSSAGPFLPTGHRSGLPLLLNLHLSTSNPFCDRNTTAIHNTNRKPSDFFFSTFNLGVTNPFSIFVWFWRGWRGGSVTFAALFALALFGVSAIGGLRHVLHKLGAPWYLWLLVPVAIITALARWETQWIPDARLRRRYAWIIVGSAILIAVAIAKLRPDAALPAPHPTVQTRFKG